MSYGVRLWNDSGVVTVDSEAIGPVYVGRATLVQAGGPDWNYYNPRWNSWRFQVTMPRAGFPPLAFVTLRDGQPVGVEYVAPAGGNVWEIGVYSAVRYSGNLTWDDPVEPEVFVFAPPGATQAGQYGMALYNAAGTLTWDLSQRPLWIRQMAAMSAPPDFSWSSFYDTSFGLSGLTKPAVLGSPNGSWSAMESATEQFADGRHAWLRSGGTVFRRPVLVHKDIITTAPDTFPTFFLGGTRAVIIEAAGL